jgi:hypothetical protein
MNNYLCSITVGDTDLDLYGYACNPEDDIGYTGDLEIEDVRVCCKDPKEGVSIFEMVVNTPLWDHICQVAHENYSFEDDGGYDG